MTNPPPPGKYPPPSGNYPPPPPGGAGHPPPVMARFPARWATCRSRPTRRGSSGSSRSSSTSSQSGSSPVSRLASACPPSPTPPVIPENAGACHDGACHHGNARHLRGVVAGVRVSALEPGLPPGHHGSKHRQVGDEDQLVSAATGRPIGFGMAFVRDIAHFIDSIIFGIGYLLPLFTEKRQTIADMMMSTVCLPAEPPRARRSRTPRPRIRMALGVVVLASAATLTVLACLASTSHWACTNGGRFPYCGPQGEEASDWWRYEKWVGPIAEGPYSFLGPYVQAAFVPPLWTAGILILRRYYGRHICLSRLRASLRSAYLRRVDMTGAGNIITLRS